MVRVAALSEGGVAAVVEALGGCTTAAVETLGACTTLRVEGSKVDEVAAGTANPPCSGKCPDPRPAPTIGMTKYDTLGTLRTRG